MDGKNNEPISSEEMKAVEINSSYLCISTLQLMENAGTEVSRWILSNFASKKMNVTVFAGIGGNGGDGLVAARHLAPFFPITVVLVGKPDEIKNPATKTNWNIISKMTDSVKIHVVTDSKQIPEIRSSIIIDALLGTGFSGFLREPTLEAARKINKMKSYVVAIDCPTGLNADTGAVGDIVIRADVTLTLHRPKPGLLLSRDCVGKLFNVNIGIPSEAELYTGPGDVYLAASRRKTSSHKGENGRLLVIGGSETYTGSPALAAMAALRTGVDLTYITAPEKTALALSSMSPDLITIKLEGKHLSLKNIPSIKNMLSKVDAVVMGPGLGLHEETVKAVENIVDIVEQKQLPLLLDADGLKAFAGGIRKLNTPLVYTPHSTEYAILTGTVPPEDLKARTKHVREEAAKLGAVILLKGPVDIVSDGLRSKLNFTGNPGMTVGGTGDTLSGIVGAFLSQKIGPFRASVGAAFINGCAGDLVVAEKGYHMVASDIIEKVPEAIESALSFC
jgi:ADP-dependent NAD(P)H-hydrate dehydratase / NAD(P)H-hydrate epimerase